MAELKDKTDQVYDAYKAQSSSRQKYYLAIVVGIVCGLIGYLVGAM